MGVLMSISVEPTDTKNPPPWQSWTWFAVGSDGRAMFHLDADDKNFPTHQAATAAAKEAVRAMAACAGIDVKLAPDDGDDLFLEVHQQAEAALAPGRSY